MRDKPPNEQLKIELLSQWKLEAEFRNTHSELTILAFFTFQADAPFYGTLVSIERSGTTSYSCLCDVTVKKKKRN